VVPSDVDRSSAGLAILTGPLPAGPLTIAPGGSQTFTWTFNTSSAGALNLTFSATGSDANSGLPVTGAVTVNVANAVQTPPAVTGDLVASTNSPLVGVPFTITLTLSNSGGATASAVPLPLLNLFGAGISITATPTGFPVSIAAGATVTMTWTVVGTSAGNITYSLTASGQDLNSGATFSQFITAAAALPMAGGGLQVVSLVPSTGQLAIGSSLSLTMTVKNPGSSTVFTVGPSFISPSGSGGVSQTGGPTPGAVSEIDPGLTTTFVWTFHADRAGSVTFSGAAGGTDAGGLTSIVSPTVASSAVTITGAGSIDEGEIYPLPYIPGQGTLKFHKLPANSRIRIYTTAGELVAELVGDQLGNAEWNGRNKSGTFAVRGVYFYVIQPPSGARKVGKFEVSK
jgi:hypothetical protein